jgi:hypothetical protein
VLLLNECLLLFISLSSQSGNFWIHRRTGLTAQYLTFASLGRIFLQMFRLTKNVRNVMGGHDVWVKRCTHTTFRLENLIRKVYMKDLNIDEGIILGVMLEK